MQKYCPEKKGEINIIVRICHIKLGIRQLNLNVGTKYIIEMIFIWPSLSMTPWSNEPLWCLWNIVVAEMCGHAFKRPPPKFLKSCVAVRIWPILVWILNILAQTKTRVRSHDFNFESMLVTRRISFLIPFKTRTLTPTRVRVRQLLLTRTP